MIKHPNPKVNKFTKWVSDYYSVSTEGLSTVWWGRLLQKTKFFKMAAIQLGSSIWINDVDNDGDGERDYWANDRAFSCIALVAHELWHVLQKRSKKTARWNYLAPQIYSIFLLPAVIAGVATGMWWLAGLSGVMLLSLLLPAHAPSRLMQEAEAYSWNRYVAELLCDGHEATLQLLEAQRASFTCMCGPSYYYMTRDFEEARSFLIRCERIPYTESALQTAVQRTVEELKQDIK